MDLSKILDKNIKISNKMVAFSLANKVIIDSSLVYSTSM